MELDSKFAKLKSLFICDWQICATYCVNGIISMALVSHLGNLRTYQGLRHVFKRPIQISESASKARSFFASGRITIDPHSTSSDPALGMVSPVKGSLGLYRKVEGLTKQNTWVEPSHPYNNHLRYRNHQHLGINYGSFLNSKVDSQIFMNPSIRLQDLKIQNLVFGPLMQPDSNATRIQINRALIESTYENIKINPLQENPNADVAVLEEAIRIFKEHPFSTKKSSDQYASQVVVQYDSDYIYLRASAEKQTHGDIRISYHDFGTLSDITLLASLEGDTITPFKREFKPIMESNTLKIKRNGKIEKLNADQVSFIVKGILSQEEMVKHAMKSMKSEYTHAKVLASVVAIFLLNYLFYNRILSVLVSNEDSNVVDLVNSDKNENDLLNIDQLPSVEERSIYLSLFQIGCYWMFSNGALWAIYLPFLGFLFENFKFKRDYVKIVQEMKEEIIQKLEIVPPSHIQQTNYSVSDFNHILQKHLTIE